MPQRILASLKYLVNNGKYLIEPPFSLHKCPKPSWQGFRPPPKPSKCPFDLGKFFSKKVPQTIRARVETPPPLTGNAQMPRTWIWVGLPLFFHHFQLLLCLGWIKFFGFSFQQWIFFFSWPGCRQQLAGRISPQGRKSGLVEILLSDVLCSQKVIKMITTTTIKHTFSRTDFSTRQEIEY